MKYLLCRVRCLLRYDVLSVSTKKGAREREMARERCTDLCTKEASGQCAHCDALDDRDRFERPFRAVVTPCVKGLRWLRAHATPVLLTVVSLGFLGPIIYAWWLQLDQLDQPITCHVILEKLQERNSGLNIRLTEHHSSEPLFSGKSSILSLLIHATLGYLPLLLPAHKQHVGTFSDHRFQKTLNLLQRLAVIKSSLLIPHDLSSR
jgi:hypothetical protein